MALRATIYKADLSVANLDDQHYADYALTIARHPSETEERLMMRMVAYALFADPALTFATGLSTGDEPDLWIKDLTGAIQLWIEVGLPDERVLRKASGRSEKVVVISFGGKREEMWWAQTAPAVNRLNNLSVFHVEAIGGAALASLAQRTMRLSAMIQDGQVLLSSGDESVTVTVSKRF